MKIALTWYCLLIMLITVIDRLTKLWAIRSCSLPQELMPGLSCHLIYNKGISWGMLPLDNPIAYGLMTIALFALISYMAYYAYKRFYGGYLILGEAFVIAGGLGNIFDRVWYGAVVDFIRLGYGGIEFPTLFNAADIAVVGGVFLMLVFTKFK